MRTGWRANGFVVFCKVGVAGRVPELILSRSSLNFVRRLFEVEVAEIADGTVALAAIAYDPGYRTKVCGRALTEGGPVGARGSSGSRVRASFMR